MVRCSAGDVVWYEATQLVVGKVRLHIFCEPTPEGTSGFWSLVDEFRFLEKERWQATGELAWVQLERIEAVAVWAPNGADVRVLPPPHRVYTR